MTEAVGTEAQEFSAIYARLARVVTENAAERKLAPPPMRDPSVAHLSLLDVPRATLLAVDDDAAFIASCYLVLMDVAPSKKQVNARLRWLREGTRTREEILDQILASDTFAHTGRRVSFS